MKMPPGEGTADPPSSLTCGQLTKVLLITTGRLDDLTANTSTCPPARFPQETDLQSVQDCFPPNLELGCLHRVEGTEKAEEQKFSDIQ